jgi:hypothetical protein
MYYNPESEENREKSGEIYAVTVKGNGKAKLLVQDSKS